MGEPRKTNSHSPLEILPGLYTAIFKEGQLQPREMQGLSSDAIEPGPVYAYKACANAHFFVGTTRILTAIGWCNR
ncbi:hypothetical protein [Paraburkholderia kururiensis]|uniref:Uncharacterized protein n=1 Tax=Paraburkholderia kururiensis TaxID=984307 RepID=A0ABZ0WEZ1_9BURK|nr:hypothetical protein [Paraburkholderia kururiensis]WQD75872.1 hypothetical protein U0042_17255 [Paraburkholderia kururiensis]